MINKTPVTDVSGLCTVFGALVYSTTPCSAATTQQGYEKGHMLGCYKENFCLTCQKKIEFNTKSEELAVSAAQKRILGGKVAYLNKANTGVQFQVGAYDEKMVAGSTINKFSDLNSNRVSNVLDRFNGYGSSANVSNKTVIDAFIPLENRTITDTLTPANNIFELIKRGVQKKDVKQTKNRESEIEFCKEVDSPKIENNQIQMVGEVNKNKNEEPETAVVLIEEGFNVKEKQKEIIKLREEIRQLKTMSQRLVGKKNIEYEYDGQKGHVRKMYFPTPILINLTMYAILITDFFQEVCLDKNELDKRTYSLPREFRLILQTRKTIRKAAVKELSDMGYSKYTMKKRTTTGYYLGIINALKNRRKDVYAVPREWAFDGVYTG